jgi:hypothetical protein
MRPLAILVTLFAVTSPAGADGPFARLSAPRTIARGAHMGPRFSPDGRSLLVSGERWSGLSLVGLDGAVRRLVDDVAAGVDARFLADGRIAFSARRAGERRTLLVDPGALSATSVRLAAVGELPEPPAFAKDDRLYVRTAAGLTTVGAGDKFFGARPSPDGARVAFLGLATGVHVLDLRTMRVTHVGAGTAPAWSPDGRLLVFERTEDDGHDVVASDLWLYEPGGRGLTRLTATDDRLERRPSFSPDGRRLAFDDDRGEILIADLEVSR